MMAMMIKVNIDADVDTNIDDDWIRRMVTARLACIHDRLIFKTNSGFNHHVQVDFLHFSWKIQFVTVLISDILGGNCEKMDFIRFSKGSFWAWAFFSNYLHCWISYLQLLEDHIYLRKQWKRLSSVLQFWLFCRMLWMGKYVMSNSLETLSI